MIVYFIWKGKCILKTISTITMGIPLFYSEGCSRLLMWPVPFICVRCGPQFTLATWRRLAVGPGWPLTADVQYRQLGLITSRNTGGFCFMRARGLIKEGTWTLWDKLINVFDKRGLGPVGGVQLWPAIIPPRDVAELWPFDHRRA